MQRIRHPIGIGNVVKDEKIGKVPRPLLKIGQNLFQTATLGISKSKHDRVLQNPLPIGHGLSTGRSGGSRLWYREGRKIGTACGGSLCS